MDIRWAVGDFKPACDRAVELQDLDALALLADHHPHSDHCSSWEVLAWPCPAVANVLTSLFSGELEAHRTRSTDPERTQTWTMVEEASPPLDALTRKIMGAVAAVTAAGLGAGLPPDELAGLVRIALTATEAELT